MVHTRVCCFNQRPRPLVAGRSRLATQPAAAQNLRDPSTVRSRSRMRPRRHPGWDMATPLYRTGTVIRIAIAAGAGLAGCATTPDMGWNVPEVEGTEEEVVCSGGCEEEWRRAEEWVKKYSGYPFPAEIAVRPDRIAATRVPLHDCVSVPQTRSQFLARCTRPPLASEPLGIGDDDEPGSMIGKTFADGGPHWTFLVLREARERERGRSHIRLVQRCWARRGPLVCGMPGIRRHRQDAFRRFVRTGEHPSR